MFKKILVGLDGSAHSLRAADTATRLARQLGSELHILTVTRPFKVTPKLRQYLEAENLLGEPKYVLDEMTNEIINEAKSVAEKAQLKKVVSEVREGRPARTIVEYAKINGIDLIVLGARGAGETDSALLGSVSQKVSILSECTVMIVR